MKRLKILRPELEAEFIRPIRGRLVLLRHLPQLIRVARWESFIFIIIPKIRAVKGHE